MITTAATMARRITLNNNPQVGDTVCVHLAPGLMNPLCGEIMEVMGVHVLVALNDMEGVYVIVHRNTVTWA